MKQLLQEIHNCRLCEQHLEHGVNPVIAASAASSIVIIGQAPGSIVHKTGIPWNDKSGDTLRNWMGVNKEQFYDTGIFALMPMGFCYPGKGRSGDLPPRAECAPAWHAKILAQLENVKLILLIGQYAQNYYLQDKAMPTLTDTVRNFENYLPRYLPLPHPSPRNNIWQAKNKWFTTDVLPVLAQKISTVIGKSL